MIRSADHDRIDLALIVQHLAKVLIHFRLGIALEDVSREVRVCIAQGIDVGELPWFLFLWSLPLLPTLPLPSGPPRSPLSSPGLHLGNLFWSEWLARSAAHGPLDRHIGISKTCYILSASSSDTYPGNIDHITGRLVTGSTQYVARNNRKRGSCRAGRSQKFPP
jgi:hypothetical protein